MTCAFFVMEKREPKIIYSPGVRYLLPNDVTSKWNQVSRRRQHVHNFDTMFSFHTTVQKLFFCTMNEGVYDFGCRVHLMLCCFESLYCSLSFTDQMEKKKIAPPPVDLSILLLRQLDQCHGNLDWLDVVRRWVCAVAVLHTSLCQGPDVLGRSWFSAKWSFCLNAGTLRIHTDPTLNWKQII